MSSLTPKDIEFLRDALKLDKQALKNVTKPKKAAEAECLLAFAKEAGSEAAAHSSAMQKLAKGLKHTAFIKANRLRLVKYLTTGKITSSPQISAATKYFNDKKRTEFKEAEFEKACGVGVVVTTAEIEATVKKVIESHKAEIVKDGWQSKMLGRGLGECQQRLKWGDKALVTDTWNKHVEALAGPKTSRKKGKDEDLPEKWETASKRVKGDEINSAELIAARKAAVGDVFITRFPPEPNGYMHLGHAKSTNWNYGLAKNHKGKCILRFDDTNPTKEDVEYIESIIADTKWLGHDVVEVTYSSDHFPALYKFAEQLIEQGDAYVCEQTAEEMKADRDAMRKDPKLIKASPFRDRSTKENFRLFRLMKCGAFDEGQMCLRMKGDLHSTNPNMKADHVIYRIMYTAHPHVGNKWCIYPTYDMTHCVIDSLEWISASCCTLEFDSRRETYYWLLKKLGLYRPVVWEYSRLCMSHNVVSKRVLRRLIETGAVRGWDDPRLLTVSALKRRGVPPDAINKFCESRGTTRNANTVDEDAMYFFVRKHYDPTASRKMAVTEPLRVVIENWPKGKSERIKGKDFPGQAAHGNKEKANMTYDVELSSVVYIERSDFREKPDPSFFRLAPGKTIRLKYAMYSLTYKSHSKNASGEIDEVRVTYDPKSRESMGSGGEKQFFLTWVSGSKPVRTEFRLYNQLFDIPNPDKSLAGLNPNSLVVTHGYVDPAVLKYSDKIFQFERLGYFYKDLDSTPELPVFNRTCELRAKKKGS